MTRIAVDNKDLLIGFVGTGAIAEAMCIGILEHSNFSGSILLSERSTKRSSALANQYEQVEVVSEIQDLLDRSDLVILSTLPTQLESALDGVTFKENHVVISLVAATFLNKLAELVSPARRICRLIPMPPIEMGVGPIALCPRDEEIIDFLSDLGKVVPVDDEIQFDLMSAASSVMASFFEWSAAVSKWMEAQGFDKDASAKYVSSLFEALTVMLKDKDFDQVQGMSNEVITKGGLNEQFLAFNSRAGFFDKLPEGLDEILARIQDY